MTFGDTPNIDSSNENNESITRPPNYSAAVPVKWSHIRPNSPSNNIPKKKESLEKRNELGIAVRNYSQSDPLGIFPTRNNTEQVSGHGSVDIRDKYPQLFLANHLAQVMNNEQSNNGKEQHSSGYSKVIK